MRDLRTAAPLAAFTALLLAAAGCGESTSPEDESRPTEALNFLRPAPDAPPIANPVVSFYAKRGENREATIWYRPRPGEADSSEFVSFEVPGGALDRLPNGAAIAPGDSVLITIRVIDPARLIVDLQPTGLRFSQSTPAQLEISFAEAHDDLDGDGDLDGDDARARQSFYIWRQERAGDPWVRIGSITDFDFEEVEADLFGFSGYAIAF